MLCSVCKDGLEGMWDPSRSKRLILFKDFRPGVSRDTEQSLDRRHASSANDFSRYKVGEYVYGHHKSKASFLASIRKGCAMCNRFSLLRSDGNNSRLKSLGYFSVFYVSLDQERSVDGHFMIVVQVENIQGSFDLVPLGDLKGDNNMNFGLGLSNHDSKAWAIMQTWMKTCSESHAQCKLLRTSASYRPTRLLRLDSSQTFHLVTGDECPPNVQYVALSYCWGTKPVERLLRLLESTVESLRLEQPIDNLPKTFREAMSVAQRFSVDYIWIDRLCIFQDSPDDWKREASAMQDVYRNAVFSIAALGAMDDDAGLFFERDPDEIAPTIIHFKLAEDGEEKAFRFGLEKGWSWRLSFENEPLVQRSWVVQERLLAPRTLHFGSKQLFWECHEASCCEMHPHNVYCSDGFDDIEEMDRPPGSPYLWKQLLDAPDRNQVSEPYEQLFFDWASYTQYYVSRQLTVPSDKLTALSGLANDMRAKLCQLKPGPHRYLAGHWEEKLMETLVWNVRSPATRALQYRAPSWSWACLDGHLNLYGGCMWRTETISFTSMVSVAMTYLGERDTGAVSGGILTLVGPYAMVKIDLDRDTHMTRWPKNEKYVQSLKDDKGNDLSMKEKDDFKVIFDTMDDITEEAIMLWICSHHFHDERWYGHGLVLVRVEEDTYRRSGMATCYFDKKETATAFTTGFALKQIKIV
ncbi:hypothetical protein NLU13_8239 [Sarocladium strictum]|uniref:Heterokaryon incompatibility domain-containing protein n=1 Tax=Sarocladium strictum TaxID=5046 RepID=A0AA39GBB5_SARSR|nr:hypothetical protein NLU13_8239 [Sarocladium strictum]